MSSPDSLRAPLLWLLVPFATGIVLAIQFAVPRIGLWPFFLSAIVLALGAVTFSFRDRATGASLALVLSVSASGFSVTHARFPYLHEWSQRPPREITLVIEIYHEFSAAPDARSFGGLARVANHPRNDPSLRDRLLFYSAIRRISQPVDRTGIYLMQGVLEPLPRTNQSGFEQYLAAGAIRHRLVRARVQEEIEPPKRAAAFYSAAQRRFQRILGTGLAAHPSERSLYCGMVLGETASLTPQQENAFMRSGTFHVFSVSGLHVSVIAAALLFLLRALHIPSVPRMIISLLTLWLYVQITGGSSPAVRAFLMFAFILARFAFQQPGNLFSALVGSAFATLLIDPLQIVSTGFQMSYAVMIALIVMGGPLGECWLAHWKPFALLPVRQWRWWHRSVRWTGSWLVISLAGGCAAFLTSVPAGIGFFGLLSTGSLLANLFVIPLSFVTINAGFLSLVAGLCGLSFVSVILNRLAAVLIHIMDWLLQRGVELPGVAFEAQFRASWLAPVALLLTVTVLVTCASGRWARSRGGFWPPLLLMILIVLTGVRFGMPATEERISVKSPPAAVIPDS